jgi:hypothetical protein
MNTLGSEEMLSIYVKRQEGEAWRDFALRVAKLHGLDEAKVMQSYDKSVEENRKNGKPLESHYTAWFALFDNDLDLGLRKISMTISMERQEGETWRDTVARYGAKGGPEKQAELLDRFECNLQDRHQYHDQEHDAALFACCQDWDIVDLDYAEMDADE